MAEEATTVEAMPKTDAEYEAAIDNLITEMKRVREQFLTHAGSELKDP